MLQLLPVITGVTVAGCCHKLLRQQTCSGDYKPMLLMLAATAAITAITAAAADRSTSCLPDYC
jgi:hypothetical protein